METYLHEYVDVEGEFLIFSREIELINWRLPLLKPLVALNGIVYVLLDGEKIYANFKFVGRAN
jgi:hypothetical protein